MPSSDARRRIVSESGPSASRIAPATSTICCWRALDLSGALEAIGPSQTIPDGTIDRDMQRPTERCRQPDRQNHAGEHEPAEQNRTGKSMQCVVNWHRARRELPLFETASCSSEQAEIWHKRKSKRQPTAAVVLHLQNGRSEQ